MSDIAQLRRNRSDEEEWFVHCQHCGFVVEEVTLEEAEEVFEEHTARDPHGFNTLGHQEAKWQYMDIENMNKHQLEKKESRLESEIDKAMEDLRSLYWERTKVKAHLLYQGESV